jgi:hypothetical protein
MLTCRALFAALLLNVAVASAADIFPVKGDPIKGDIVSVSDKAIVYKAGGKEVTRPIKEVLKIDYRDTGKAATGTTYSMVELTDGSQLFASKLLLKKKELELTLLSGQAIKLPSAVVASILNGAEVEANRRDWKSRAFKNRGKEGVVVKNKTGTGASTLECTLGDGDETGTAITIAVALGGEIQTANRKIASLRGILFKHVLDPKASPVSCKVLDTMQGIVMVSGVTVKDGVFALTTPAGATIDLKADQVARLDYTKGRLEYLSDFKQGENVKVVGKSNLADSSDPEKWHVYLDTNINKQKIVVGGTSYLKGLGLVPQVELTYDLNGEFREFEAMAGFDGGVPADGTVILTIEGDGKELSKTSISSKDKKNFHNLLLNVKDVQKLKITVESDSEFDTSLHLDLADAKVRKE